MDLLQNTRLPDNKYGLCNNLDRYRLKLNSTVENPIFNLFHPTEDDFAELRREDLPTIYWAYGELFDGYGNDYLDIRLNITPLRATILMLCYEMAVQGCMVEGDENDKLEGERERGRKGKKGREGTLGTGANHGLLGIRGDGWGWVWWHVTSPQHKLSRNRARIYK